MSAPTIDRLLQHQGTLLTRVQDGAPDEYGNPAWTVTGETATRCELQQAGAREEQDGAVQIVTWRVWLPPTAPARGWDAIRLDDGRTLELEGDAWPVVNPRTGGLHHLECYARETE
jgi:hypothetical protein